MSLILGFDPGGAGRFGWCAALDSHKLPLSLVAAGTADDARSAVGAAVAAVPRGEVVAAAGIDAPLVWSRSGPRNADRVVRNAIKNAGAPHPAGTVQDVNSLRGACLVQGFLAAVELRERFPALPLTEAHPKALRWLSSDASEIDRSSEHERDAILAAVTGWALVHKPAEWVDLYLAEREVFTPLQPPLSYFMPRRII